MEIGPGNRDHICSARIYQNLISKCLIPVDSRRFRHSDCEVILNGGCKTFRVLAGWLSNSIYSFSLWPTLVGYKRHQKLMNLCWFVQTFELLATNFLMIWLTTVKPRLPLSRSVWHKWSQIFNYLIHSHIGTKYIREPIILNTRATVVNFILETFTDKLTRVECFPGINRTILRQLAQRDHSGSFMLSNQNRRTVCANLI